MQLFNFKKIFIVCIFLFITGRSFAQVSVFFTQRDSGCVGSVFPFLAIVNSPGDPVVMYSWDFGDGTPVVNTTSAAQVHQFNTPGIFDVTLNVITQNGDTGTLTEPGFIKVGSKPTAIIDSVFHDICFQGSVQFNDLSPQPVTGWHWFFGAGSQSYDQHPVNEFYFDTSGTADPFDIILIAYNNGCGDTDTVVNMVAVRGPIPDFNYSHDCSLPNNILFTNLSGGADNYSWDFDDGSPNDTSTDVSHIYPGPGIYNVILTANNVSNNCSVDTIYSVFVSDVFSATLYEAGPYLICEPHGTNYSYEWYFNGSLSATCTTDTCDAQQSGDYYVIVTDFISGCLDSTQLYSFTVSVNEFEFIDQIMLYPIPVIDDFITVDFGNAKHETVTVNFFDAFGRSIQREEIDLINSFYKKQFDLTAHGAGVYFVSIEMDNRIVIKRIIKS